jgi:hypothetical protein
MVLDQYYYLALWIAFHGLQQMREVELIASAIWSNENFSIYRRSVLALFEFRQGQDNGRMTQKRHNSPGMCSA